VLLRGSVLALEALQLIKREKRYRVGSSSPITFEFMFANAALLRILHACCAWRPYCNMIMNYTTFIMHYTTFTTFIILLREQNKHT
jgi:hypothetical protein